MVVHELQATAEEDDEDSLFGSPPPPEFEGRAASPALALPSSASAYKSLSASNAPVSVAAGIHNVGTIALPGSQLDSEFPLHPLALSLSHGMVPRPPALPEKQPQTIAASTTTIPSAPPPCHYLRNQENLLGKAGRVGGITTTLPQPRGSTPFNPILIDDDNDAPIIGRRSSSKSRETSQIPIDPIKLAQPTNEEIVSVLVGQRDIFPVLESILKLIAKGAQPKQLHRRPTGFERHLPGSPPHEWSMGPPTKKRKLNRVPAGATDWDVPFPFADGEGPTAYHQNWERDRGKQLISELIKLIKVASRKAAAKRYISEQKRDSQETGGEKNIEGDTEPSASLMSTHAATSVPPTTMFDAWMDLLDTFPIDFDGAGAGTQVLSSETSNMTTPLSVSPSSTGEAAVDVDRERSSSGEIDFPVVDKGKAREVEPPTVTTMVETVPQFGPVTQSVFDALHSTKTRDEPACMTGSASSTIPSTSATAKSIKRKNETDSERSARQHRKEDIIRRAKERRQEIQEGLNDIKRQLWETMIEQAALLHLTNKLEVDGSEG